MLACTRGAASAVAAAGWRSRLFSRIEAMLRPPSAPIVSARALPASARSALETVRRRGVPADADRDATLRRMRADAREGSRLCHRQQPLDRPDMGTAFTPAKTSSASWDAFSDVDAFVDAVLTELAAMVVDGTRSTRSGPKAPLTGAALRRAIMAIWCVCFCGMQWRAIGQLCDIPFGTLYTLFARWTRLGLWRRLLDRLILAWRQACGDTPEPSTVILDSVAQRRAASTAASMV